MSNDNQLRHLSSDELIAEMARRNGCQIIVIPRNHYKQTLKALNKLADDQMKAYTRVADCMVSLDKGVKAS